MYNAVVFGSALAGAGVAMWFLGVGIGSFFVFTGLFWAGTGGYLIWNTRLDRVNTIYGIQDTHTGEIIYKGDENE